MKKTTVYEETKGTVKVGDEIFVIDVYNINNFEQLSMLITAKFTTELFGIKVDDTYKLFGITKKYIP